jgi:hypothetical protein
MILEPSEELQIVYDKALEIANSHNHEYLTFQIKIYSNRIGHFLFASIFVNN